MTLHLLSTLAVARAMRGLLGRCEAAAGMPVTADFMPTLGRSPASAVGSGRMQWS
ncbi:hypothetical protein ACFQX4_19105 [Roseomonas sp. GCM10028921]